MPKRKRPSMLAVSSAIAMTLILTGCAHRTSSAVLDRRIVCVAFEPIQFDRLNDTLPTIASVKEHNAAWSAVCTHMETK